MWLTLHKIKDDKTQVLFDVNTDAIESVLQAPEGGIYILWQSGRLDQFAESFPRWQEWVRGR